MKIYVACGLTHVPRAIFEKYTEYLHALASALLQLSSVHEVKYALINSDPQLSEKPKEDRAKLCYAWDRRMVEGADLVIADASFPSTGLGIELQVAEACGIPVILLIGDYGANRVLPVTYENPDRRVHELQIGEGIVSLMALGLPAISEVIEYKESSEAIVRAVDAAIVFGLE